MTGGVRGPDGRARTVIVGGGLLGLGLARELAEGPEGGAGVVVLEAAAEIGGLAAAWEVGGFTWDRHYHVILRSDRRLRALLRDLGLEGELRWAAAGTAFHAGGRTWPLTRPADFVRFPLVGPSAKVRLVLTLLRARLVRDGAPLEALTAERWLRRWSGRAAVAAVWEPLLRAKLGPGHRAASARFIQGTLARLHGAREAGAGPESFGYVEGGYGRILDRLAGCLRERGVEVRWSFPVAAVSRAGTAGLEVRATDGRVMVAERVVVTVAPPRAAAICAGLGAEERARLAAVEMLGVVCASVLLAAPPGPYYVTNLADPALPLTGIIETGAHTGPRPFGGGTLVYLPRYAPAGDPAWEWDDAEVGRRFLGALAAVRPELAAGAVRACRVSRARDVLPFPALHYTARRRPPLATSVPGLWLASGARVADRPLSVDAVLGVAAEAAAVLDGAAPAGPAGGAGR